MTLPVHVTFRDMPSSPALHSAVEEHAQRLQRFAPQIHRCEVVVQYSERRHHRGNRYLVHVRLLMPGAQIDAGRTPNDDESHEDVYVALRDAFDAARRQLEDFVRVRRGDVKTHTPTEPPVA